MGDKQDFCRDSINLLGDINWFENSSKIMIDNNTKYKTEIKQMPMHEEDCNHYGDPKQETSL